MKKYILNYYPEFQCVAEKCKHTCCAGWEMCIDDKTLTAYQNEKSDFKDKLKQGVNFKKAKFKADKKGRCAFLNDKGLCDIVINLGKESLCQVCSDHPRFRSFFNGIEETGLGFCCEEASRIILSSQEKIEQVLVSDDGAQEQLDFNQKNVLDFRKKAIDILQDRSLSINDRIQKTIKLCKAEIKEQDLKRIIKTLLSLERVDKSWGKRLKSIKKPYIMATEQGLTTIAEQFLVNSLYRHLSDAEDTMWVRARAIACIYSWLVIKSIIDNERAEQKDLFELVVDVVREYSLEVEYSQKNLNKLFLVCYKFIEI